MQATSYTALWSDGDTAPLAGAIALDGTALSLEGCRAGRQARRNISYDRIASLRVGRANGERLRGRTALVLELVDGTTIRVATPEPGVLHELVETLTHELGKVKS